jgi:hypothetical protein
LSLPEAVQLGARILESCTKDKEQLDHIDIELHNICAETNRIVFLIATIIVGIASVISSAAISLIRSVAIPSLCAVLVAQLRAQLQKACQNTRETLEWSQLSVELLAEKHSTILRTIKHLRSAEEKASPLSPELQTISKQLKSKLEDTALSISHELHRRATEASKAKRQAVAARRAKDLSEETAEASGSWSNFLRLLKELMYAILFLLGLLCDGVFYLMERLLDAILGMLSSLEALFS